MMQALIMRWGRKQKQYNNTLLAALARVSSVMLVLYYVNLHSANLQIFVSMQKGQSYA